MATAAVRGFFCDEHAWCEECGRSVQGGCSLHTLIRVADRVRPSHARLTLPGSLKLQTTGPLQEDWGVFAKKVIQKRSNFGPAEGELVDGTAVAEADCQRYHFKIFNCTDGTYKFLNNQNEETGNWMMFVRPAASACEQNLVAYQHNGSIYMTASKVIHPGTELRFWYAKDYAHLVDKALLLGSAGDAAPQGQTAPPCRMLSTPGGRTTAREPATVSRQQLQNSDLLPAGRAKAGLRSFRSKPTATSVSSSTDQPRGVAFWQCSFCERAFDTSRQLELHSCDRMQLAVAVAPLDGTAENPAAASVAGSCALSGGFGGCAGDGGRRTRNKRKGRPKKVLAVGGRKRRKGTAAAATGVSTAAAAMATAAGTAASAAGIAAQAAAATVGATVALPTMEGANAEAAVPGLPQQQQQRAPLKCQHCPLEFATRGKLLTHGYAHTGERPFRCGQAGCGKSFSSKFKLARHELIHQPQKRYRCRFCDKPFSRRDHLNNHLVLHDDKRSLHVCEYCHKSYSTLHAYRTHVAYHRALAGELACSVCLKRFDSGEALVLHIKVHAGSRSVRGATEKRFCCGECDKRFFTQKDVRRHQVTHTKEKKFACRLCPQRFGRQDHLTRHLKKNHCAAASGPTVAALVRPVEFAPADEEAAGAKSPPAGSGDGSDILMAAAAAAAVGGSGDGFGVSRARRGVRSERRPLVLDMAGSLQQQQLHVLHAQVPPGTVELDSTFSDLASADRPAHGPPEYVSVSVFPGAMSPGGQHQQYFLFNGFGMTAATAAQVGLATHLDGTGSDRGKCAAGVGGEGHGCGGDGIVDASGNGGGRDPRLSAAWQPVLVTTSAQAGVATGDGQGRYRSPELVNVAAATTLMSATCGRDSGTVLLDCSGPLQPAVGQGEEGGCSVHRPSQPAGAADVPNTEQLLARASAVSAQAESCCTSSAASDYLEAMKVLGSFSVSAGTAPSVAMQIVPQQTLGLPAQQQHGSTDGVSDLYTAAASGAQHYVPQGFVYR